MPRPVLGTAPCSAPPRARHPCRAPVPRAAGRIGARAPARGRGTGADPDPLRGLLQEQVADREEPGDPQAQRVAVEPLGLDLDGGDRPVVRGKAELDEGELVVPAKQLPVRPAHRVADGRRHVEPDEGPDGRIQDDRHRHVEAAPAVKPEIPGARPLPVDPDRGLEAQLGEPGLDRRCVGNGAAAQSALDRPAPVEGRPAPADASAAWPAALAGSAGAPCRLRPRPSWRTIVAPDSTVRLTKSVARTFGSIRTLRPIRTPRGMTACLPTIVIPVLRWPGVRRFAIPRSVPSPTIAPGPTVTSLSRIARSMIAPGRIPASHMTMESRTTAPTPTTTPGERTELTTIPSTRQPCEIRLRWIWAVAPTLPGARSSERVWMSHSRS